MRVDYRFAFVDKVLDDLLCSCWLVLGIIWGYVGKLLDICIPSSPKDSGSYDSGRSKMSNTNEAPLGKPWKVMVVKQDDGRNGDHEASFTSNQTACRKRPKARYRS